MTFLLAALLWTAAPALASDADPPAPPKTPRLIVLLAVDQLTPDRVDASLPGGLGRLVREGRVFTNAALAHAGTATCPGHVAMSTGVHPGRAGVPGNSYIDRATAKPVYCVEDPDPAARVIGGKLGRSPMKIRVDALGDWLKAAHPRAKVVAVSGKDRAAIAMGGKRPDAVYWYDRKEALGFTTSGYYASALPDWLLDFNAGLLERVPGTWEHDAAPVPYEGVAIRADDYPYESERHSRTSPHPLQDAERPKALAQIYASPFVDALTLDVALELVEREALGSDEVPDLLAISFSGMDTVGHAYGPDSWESRDALLRLDRDVGELLAALERRAGAGRVLLALTSDHGVLRIPEWLAETGRSRCPIDGGRIGARGLIAGFIWHLHWKLGPWLAVPKRWFAVGGSGLTVNRPLVAEHGASVEDLLATAEAYLEARDEIKRVWTRREILDGAGPEDMLALYRNSFDPERSADLAIEVEPTCLVSTFADGTSHGSPHLYDRAVPVLFWGPGVTPGVSRSSVATVDVAPTLAALAGIPTPDGLDGRALSVRFIPLGSDAQR